jgi:hypothetical protein
VELDIFPSPEKVFEPAKQLISVQGVSRAALFWQVV